jgi:hypothetical protein
LHGGNQYPGSVYTPTFPGLYNAWKGLSPTLLNHILNNPTPGQSQWDTFIAGLNTNPTLAGAWDGANLITKNDAGYLADVGNPAGTPPTLGAAADAKPNESYWFLFPTDFPSDYFGDGLSVPYTYAGGSALAATEAALHGSYLFYTGCLLWVGNSFYKIDTYEALWQQAFPFGGYYKRGNLISNYIPRTNGMTPLVKDGWTVSNGNGWILIPIPAYSDSTVIIDPAWPTQNIGYPANTICNFNNNTATKIGLTNVISIVP